LCSEKNIYLSKKPKKIKTLKATFSFIGVNKTYFFFFKELTFFFLRLKRFFKLWDKKKIKGFIGKFSLRGLRARIKNSRMGHGGGVHRATIWTIFSGQKLLSFLSINLIFLNLVWNFVNKVMGGFFFFFFFRQKVVV